MSMVDKYPSVDDLIKKAKSRIPNFVFEYLDGGCNDNVAVSKNTAELRDIELRPYYITDHKEPDLRTELFGHTYDLPFGISPVGLQGLMWPNSPEILAKASLRHNIPFVISTLTTSTIERLSELTEGRAWFQLYHPKENDLRDKIMKRAEDAGCPVLVLISDMPSLAYRPWDMRNGLGLPPKMSIKNILQILGRPEWLLKTLKYGRPKFAIMEPYLESLNNQISFDNRLTEQKIAAIRDRWKGKLVIKGIASEEDTEAAIRLGVDGIVVSNHGGRQLDAGPSSIKTLGPIVENYQGKIKIMLDSGLRSGPDIARALASGAEFTFMGRNFMYAVAALGDEGGDHIIESLKIQLKQVMEQISCSSVSDLKNHLVTPFINLINTRAIA
ncbi:alpha-hydroxy acid oxidase [Mucilaginibacter sp. BT774]|uniref:alpha-hydroxy acid oxidase n=1 Tax=Mucilaginibacter sp. BT774 TaxID=3062276 RepID=UPI00267663E4|nr:alpha-hydroxy acid oxidase [Mucilaginibacter sp. BT774]MDO3626772.1 alpha-hydroxy acid oxidase [Mucilaginibacter sp. BT774]